MKEYPILFNSEMVRAILSGRKTQTRRVVKPQPRIAAREHNVFGFLDGGGPCLVTKRKGGGERIRDRISFAEDESPYGKPGDLLWVRETWSLNTGSQFDHSSHVYYKDGKCNLIHWQDGYRIGQKYGLSLDHRLRWRPSIHMPRWASRITLEVTDVRVERVQDISEEDADAEGIKNDRGKFENLWDSINGKPRKDGTDLSWGANPWVWVVEFKRKGE